MDFNKEKHIKNAVSITNNSRGYIDRLANAFEPSEHEKKWNSMTQQEKQEAFEKCLDEPLPQINNSGNGIPKKVLRPK